MNNRIRQIRKIKGSRKKEQLMVKIFKMCSEINGIKAENKGNQSLPVVMFYLHGHTNTADVEFFYNGWHKGAYPDANHYIALWSDSAAGELTKCYEELVKVKELADSKK